MSPLDFFWLSLGLSLVGAIVSLILKIWDDGAIKGACLFGILSSLSGLVTGVSCLSGPVTVFSGASPYPFAHFVLRIDPLAGLMITAISLLSLFAWIYGIGYMREYKGQGTGAMGFFMHLFIASMMLVVAVDNAFWFLIFFEMMSLSSYFLVIFEQKQDAVSAGFLYFFVAHAGSVLIMIAFYLMAAQAGSFDFEAFRHTPVSAPLASVVFLLGFIGFGAKAGMMPLHVWLPKAHPAAPSHASALMSGVMIKIGIFGIVKVGIDLLSASGTELWWGILVLIIGGISSVLGVMYAAAENDIKRLLAYSSVENVGIILLGVGTGMIGLATNHPLVATLGFLAAFYHLFNHAIFKGLLFLGAGSIIFCAHTKNMEELGGLSKVMPWTAFTFLVGAVAIAAIPPLNGFVSEWYAYQAMFEAALNGTFLVRFVTPIAAVFLAITGALAVTCFVKAYGIIFSGAPRSDHARHAKEAPLPMVIAMVVLAIFCVLLGVGAPVVAPIMGGIAAATIGTGNVLVAHGVVQVVGEHSTTVLSTPLITILMIALACLPLLLKAAFADKRLGERRAQAVWATGYLPDLHMGLNGKSFTQPIRMFFLPLYAIRRFIERIWNSVTIGFEQFIGFARRVEPWADNGIIDPVARGTTTLTTRMQVIAGGDFRVYCLHIVAALIVLLIVAAS